MIRIFSGNECDRQLSKMLAHDPLFDPKKEEQVRAIIEDVRDNGDEALIKYTKKFDGITVSADDLKVTPKEINDAYKNVDDSYLKAVKTAVKNITSFHQRQKADEWFETLPDDVVLGMRNIPIENVGIYVPGGTAVYPSSVLMNAIPAKVAGVKQVIMMTPPMKGGKIDPHILVAAAEVGVGDIFKAGGCQAIAALAFGTASVPAVDKIVGPGNIYVTIAKKLVFGHVGIDKLAGPSDIVIIADEDSEAEYIAADMLSQAEHDTDSRAILISTDMNVAKKTAREIETQIKKLKRSKIAKAAIENSCIFVVEGLKKAVEISNKLAPEHLEILSSPPQNILEKISNAGAVFLGPHSPVVVGDYIAGPNHVLPTSGSARFASPLSVYDFIKKQSILGYTKPALKGVLADIKVFADVEGLDAHSKSAEIRFS